MIVPSIDLQTRHAVQLVGGERRSPRRRRPAPWRAASALVGEIAVIDLDAAIGHGLQRRGGHRAPAAHLARAAWAGASATSTTALPLARPRRPKVILGTAATPEILRELPRERVIAALDAATATSSSRAGRKRHRARWSSASMSCATTSAHFLVTFVEREGRMAGHRPRPPRAAAAAGGPPDRRRRRGHGRGDRRARSPGPTPRSAWRSTPARFDEADGDGSRRLAASARRACGRPWCATSRASPGAGVVELESAAAGAVDRRGVYHSRRAASGRRATSGRHAGAASHRRRLRPRLRCGSPSAERRRLLPRGDGDLLGATTGLARSRRRLRTLGVTPPPLSYTAACSTTPDLLAASCSKRRASWPRPATGPTWSTRRPM